MLLTCPRKDSLLVGSGEVTFVDTPPVRVKQLLSVIIMSDAKWCRSSINSFVEIKSSSIWLHLGRVDPITTFLPTSYKNWWRKAYQTNNIDNKSGVFLGWEILIQPWCFLTLRVYHNQIKNNWICILDLVVQTENKNDLVKLRYHYTMKMKILIVHANFFIL